MIFDGIDRRQKLAERLVDGGAGAVVAEHVALEPVERAVALDHVPPAHPLPHPIDSVHRSLVLLSPGPDP